MAIDLEAIKARCEAASEGPWCWAAEDGSLMTLIQDVDEESYGDSVLACTRCDSCQNSRFNLCFWPKERDRDFIAAARTDVPALVAEVERLRALLIEELLKHESAWWHALGFVERPDDYETVRLTYLQFVRVHSDDPGQMAVINRAWECAKAALG